MDKFSNKENLYKDKLYRLKRTGGEATLFGDQPISKEMIAVINKSAQQDYDQKVLFEFRHPENGKLYVRHYKEKPYVNYIKIHIGDFKHGADYATVILNLTNEIYEPYVVICDYDAITDDADVLARMVEDAINWAFIGQAEKVKLEYWNIDQEEKKVVWAYDCMCAKRMGKNEGRIDPLVMIGHENLKTILKNGKVKPEKRAYKSDDLKDYFPNHFDDEDKELVISTLTKVLYDLKGSINVSRPIRFLIDHDVMVRPPLKAVLRQFPHLKGKLSRTRFDDYTNPNQPYFYKEEKYGKLKYVFARIIQLATKKKEA